MPIKVTLMTAWKNANFCVSRLLTQKMLNNKTLTQYKDNITQHDNT